MKIRTQGIISIVVIGIATAVWYFHPETATAPRGPLAASSVAPRGGADGAPGGRRDQGRRATSVVAAPVEIGVIADTIESVGTALANEAIIVTAKQTGTVGRINFSEGQKVAAGTPLVELDAKERRADLDTVIAMRDETLQKLARATGMRSGTVSQARIDELRTQARAAEARVSAARARREDNTIIAPFAGRVGLRQVSLGALVQPGTAVTTLDDTSVIKVEFSVPETALGRLRTGLVIEARTAAFPTRVFEGVISVIDTRVDPVTRSVRVRAEFDNADESVRPGIFLNVALALHKKTDAVLIPEEAVIANGRDHFVFKIDRGKAVRTKVTLGGRLPGKVEALTGVAAGDRVVVRGVQKVRDGQPVSVPGDADRRGPPDGSDGIRASEKGGPGPRQSPPDS